MTARVMLSIGASALVLTGSLGGCALGRPLTPGLTRAGEDAAHQAELASRALERGEATQAVTAAEAAVRLQPQSAEYRGLLGRSYIAAGRFASARAVLADALQLEPTDGRIALNLALAQIATGENGAAHATLDTHAGIIPASDRGLAMALAGDPAGAVALLTQVARSAETSVTVRQNLALSLALAGQWQAARVVAAADLSPADVDRRLQEWAAFAQPTTPSDQVASMLGVHAQPDTGLPVALALNAAVQVDQASDATPMPSEAVAQVPAAELPVTPVADQIAIRPTQATLPALDPAAPAGPRKATTIGDRLQPIKPAAVAAVAAPAPVAPITGKAPVAAKPAPRPGMALAKAAKPAAKPVTVAAKAPASAPKPLAKGEWYLQLGAFENAAVAHEKWGAATRRFRQLAALAPTGMNYTVKGGTMYRLSVGGFARPDAVSLCEAYRTRGGSCFVRKGEGDQAAQWAKPAQVASR